MSTSRRSALKRLVSAPWIAAMAVPTQQDQSQQPFDSERFARRNTGIQLLRFLNTVQLWTKLENGSYLPTEALKTSGAVARMRGLKQPPLTNIGPEFVDRLQFDSREIVVGWTLRVTLSPDKLRYLAVVSAGPDEPVLFASDTSGVIFEIASSVPAAGDDPFSAALLPGARALGQPRREQSVGRLAKAAFYVGGITGAGGRDWCWTCLGCCSCQESSCCWNSCNCACQGSNDPNFNCSNCGCGSCPWICCP